MPDKLLIKRYASRRLYNTETSEYVTLEDVTRFISAGRELRIVDLKSGVDLTRQYLLQIIAEHESRGDSVLPLSFLTDLIRSYTSHIHPVVPEFLAESFAILNEELMGNSAHRRTDYDAGSSDLENFHRRQRAYLKALRNVTPSDRLESSGDEQATKVDQIKQQLSELQAKIANL